MLRKFLRCRRVSAVALALIAGMLAAHFYAIPLWCWGVAALLGLGGACAWRRPGRVGLMLIGVAGLGAALLLLAETRPALPAEEDVTLEGIVAEAPAYQADRGRAVLVVQDGALGKVRLYLTAEEEAVAAVRVGDFVRANARLWLDAPEDFALYLWRYGIVASAFAEEAAFEPGGFSAARALDSVRAGISGKIDALFPHTADLVKALILGDRSELAEEQNDAYARAGVAHLLAVSGLHVSIIAGLFDQALRKLRVPRLVVLCVVFCALLAYSVLVGMGASIVRAVLMYAIAGVGRQLGRPRDGVQCLSVAAVIQLLIQPLWLFDAGFILSYTAIAGIQLVGEPLFQRVKGRLRHKAVRSVVQNLLVSYGACLGTLPCVVAIYGWTSAYGLLLNLVAIPLSVYATYGCVAVLFVGAAWLMAGKLLSILPEFLLFLLNWLTEWTASLPGSVLFLRPWAAWFVALFALVAVLASGRLKVPRRAATALLAVLPLLLIGHEAGVRLMAQGEVRVVFLDVEQADSAAIHAQGKLYFVDVGERYSDAAEYAARNGGRVEAVFLSHLHDDHAGGLEEVLESASVGAIYVPAGWEVYDVEEDSASALVAAREAGIPVVALSAGDEVRLSEGVTAAVLAPGLAAEESGADANAISMVLEVRYGAAAALFTGDLPADCEPDSLPDIDLLKVAHHGSAGSTSSVFLAQTAPSVAVISVGEGNPYGHPAEETLERLESAGVAVFRTDWNGDIECVLDEDGSVFASVEKEGQS